MKKKYKITRNITLPLLFVINIIIKIFMFSNGDGVPVLYFFIPAVLFSVIWIVFLFMLKESTGFNVFTLIFWIINFIAAFMTAHETATNPGNDGLIMTLNLFIMFFAPFYSLSFPITGMLMRNTDKPSYIYGEWDLWICAMIAAVFVIIAILPFILNHTLKPKSKGKSTGN